MDTIGELKRVALALFADDDWLEADEVEVYCPTCSQKMRERGVRAIRASVLKQADASARRADKWKKLPKGWTQESLKKFWDTMTGTVKKKVTKCIKEMDGKVSDPGAFCASLMDRLEGTAWRHEPRKKSSSRIAAAPPDEEYPEGEGPKIGGNHVVRMWSLEKGKAGAAELDNGDFVLLMADDAHRDFQGRLYSISYHQEMNAVRGARVWKEEALPAIFHEKPAWGSAWKSKTGRSVSDKLPYGYAQELKMTGLVPIDTPRELIDLLIRNGWKEDRKKKDGKAAWKRFGMIRVNVMTFTYGKEVYFMASIPRGVPYEQFDAFHEATKAELKAAGATVEKVEHIAKKVAKNAKAFVPKRKKPDRGDFEWRGDYGPEAYAKWRGDVAGVILEILKSHKEYYERKKEFGFTGLPSLETHDLMSDVLSNHSMEPSGMGRAKARAAVRSILDGLVKARKVRRYKDGRKIEWEIA